MFSSIFAWLAISLFALVIMITLVLFLKALEQEISEFILRRRKRKDELRKSE